MTLLNPIDALIYSMTLSAAIDGEISEKEMRTIDHLIDSLPIFKKHNQDDTKKTMSMCMEILKADSNVEELIALIDKSLNKNNKKIAYMLSLEIMMVDQNFTSEKLRALEIFENIFQISNLEASALKHSSRIKYLDNESDIEEI